MEFQPRLPWRPRGCYVAPMRRLSWLIALTLVACADDDDESNSYEPQMAIMVSPADFLGDQACRDSGGLQRYQATLTDVTLGLDESFTLPSSKVISCNSTISFEYVKEEHRYIASIVAFDRSDIKAQNPGSQVIVDTATGKSVTPRWTTTCWGEDGVDYSETIGMGGADSEDNDGSRGAGGAPTIGTTAYLGATTVVRGCDPLSSDVPLGPTGLSVDIESALIGLECGTKPGQVERFVVLAPEDGPPPSQGGAGGAGEPPEELSAKCGESVTVDGLEPDAYATLEVEVYASGESSPSWRTSCSGLTIPGVIIPTSCNPITTPN